MHVSSQNLYMNRTCHMSLVNKLVGNDSLMGNESLGNDLILVNELLGNDMLL